MAVTRSKSGQVIQMSALNDSVDGDLWLMGASYHDVAAAGNEAILKEGSNGLGIEILHFTAANNKETIYEAFVEPIRVVGGIKLTTLDSGEVFLFVSRHQQGR